MTQSTRVFWKETRTNDLLLAVGRLQDGRFEETVFYLLLLRCTTH